jgi:hypothetical protein
MYPPSLREIQRGFWRSIARRPGESAFDLRFLDNVVRGARLDSLGRVRVYADAYFLRLREVLTADFPAVARILGDERFDQMAREYLRDFPSRHPSVRYLGRAMVEFLGTASSYAPYLAELARLESLINEVFDAPDASAIRSEDLHNVPVDRWPYLRFTPIPAFALMHAGWPVHELWSGGDVERMSPTPTWLRIWRDRDDRVLHAAIDTREAEAAKRAMSGQTFAEICDVYSDLPQAEASEAAIATLSLWLECGLIAKAE